MAMITSGFYKDALTDFCDTHPPLRLERSRLLPTTGGRFEARPTLLSASSGDLRVDRQLTYYFQYLERDALYDVYGGVVSSRAGSVVSRYNG